MKKTMLCLALAVCGMDCWGQAFDEWFENATLRLDYIFAGTNRTQEVYVDQWLNYRDGLDDVIILKSCLWKVTDRLRFVMRQPAIPFTVILFLLCFRNGRLRKRLSR